MNEEKVWLEQARKGNKVAFGRLIEAYQGPVFNLAYRMLNDQAQAEEAAGRLDMARGLLSEAAAIAKEAMDDCPTTTGLLADLTRRRSQLARGAAKAAELLRRACP